MHVRGFLEFGLGFSTKYFIDNCDNVISVEFVTPGSGPEWIQYCQKLYHGRKNWASIAYFSGAGLKTDWAPVKHMGSTSVYNAASYQSSTHRSYASINNSYQVVLSSFIKTLTDSNTIDVAFIDAGIYLRGDLVQQSFNKVPIIAAHDFPTQERLTEDNVYGYGRIQVPENYVQIHILRGMGLDFWVKNEPQYAEVIKDLQAYANS